MRRREFLRASMGAGLAAGAAVKLGGYENLWKSPAASLNYDMVAVMGGEPDAMFDIGIQEFGGIGVFVKKGQKVLIKPNIGWDRVPEMGATTNPLLVKRVIEHCFRVGAKEVYIFDHTCDNWVNCYKNSGIEAAAKSAGAKVASAGSESYFQEVKINGIRLSTAKVHELLLETDVFINVPVLKVHDSTMMTGCMKNAMGLVWDRAFWHSNDLNQCIADFALYEKKPVINILDCYNVIVKNGPMGVSKEDTVTMKSLIITPDGVAGDAAAAKMLNIPVEKVEYISMAHRIGLGNMKLETQNIKRIKM